MSSTGYNRQRANDTYPGEVIEPKPRTNWHDDDTCKYCAHDRNEHGERACGVNKSASIFCRCPYGRSTK